MALDLRAKRRRRLSMTSLIDVIFLLLLFFMLSSTFSQYAEVELTAAAGGGQNQDTELHFIKLGNDQILLDGRPVAPDGIAQALQSDTPQTVLISLDRTASSQHLIDLLTLLRGIEGLRTRVMG